ncbi:MAG TPA: corrinoid protein [Longimicrobiales bacterium]
MFEAISSAVISGRSSDVNSLVQQALDSGTDAADILEHGLIAGMAVVGVRFRANEIFVPEVLIAARAMKAGMDLLEPVFTARGLPPAGTIVIGTVKGDIHDIGKNLVATMLRGAGFNVVDLGINVPAEKFCAAIAEHQPAAVALSALLTTTMPQMRVTVDAIRAAGHSTYIMVGGAPLNADFASSIGASAYGRTATDAVDIALQLVQPA